jgi:hypothetical protein
MPTTEFRLPVGGFVTPLREESKAEIARKFPKLPINQIETTFGDYLLLRDGSKDHPSPDEARNILDRAAAQADALSETISAFGPLESLVRHAASESHEDVRGLRLTLIVAASAFRHASMSIPKGRPVSSRTRLVRMLAARLQDAKLTFDARAGGSLSILTAIVLEAAGEDPGSAPKLVRDAFRGRARDKSSKS